MLRDLKQTLPTELFTRITESIKSSNTTQFGSETYNIEDGGQSKRQKESNDILRASLLNFRTRRQSSILKAQNDSSYIISLHTTTNNTTSTIDSKNKFNNHSDINTSVLDNDFIPLTEFTNSNKPTGDDSISNQVKHLAKKSFSQPGNQIPIWLKYKRNLSLALDFFGQLHEEILDLLHHVDLTITEIENRKKILAKIKAISEYLWPGCKVKLFGSFYTGLSLPDGDLDICIMNAKGTKKNNLEILADFIKRHSLAIPSSIELILNARVPIIKFIDQTHSVQIDICFDELSAIETSDFIRSNLEEFPHLRPLIILNKIFLRQRQLADTYTGGIGSYLLFTMCLGYLQHIKKLKLKSSVNEINLGQLLFYFYQFFGNDHDHNIYGIRTSKGGSIFPKSFKKWENGKSSLLTIESPLKININLGQNVFKYKQIQLSWRNAWMNLVNYWNGYPNNKDQVSLLLGMINSNDELFKNRSLDRYNTDTKYNGVSALKEKPKLSDTIINNARMNLQEIISKSKKRKLQKKKYSPVEDGKFKFKKYL